MIIQEMTENFKLKDILIATKFPKSTYYDWIKRIKEGDPDQELKDLVKIIYEENNGNYGYRRIMHSLNNDERYNGAKVGQKKVYNIMRKLGLSCIKFGHRNRKYKSYRGKVGKVAPNRINRRFNTNITYQKLTTDVTEFKIADGTKLYLSPIMDMATGEIISFSMNNRPTLDFVKDSLDAALPLIKKHAKYRVTIHSDQGWQYQHNKWVKTLKKNKIFQSMSRKGNCIDNSLMENFFGILKQEMYYGNTFSTYAELEQAIKDYIYYYNHKRIKLKLGGMSPVQYRIHTTQEGSLQAA